MPATARGCSEQRLPRVTLTGCRRQTDREFFQGADDMRMELTVVVALAMSGVSAVEASAQSRFDVDWYSVRPE